jgi:hypothetical protein
MDLKYLDTIGRRDSEWSRLLLNLGVIDAAVRAVQLAPFYDATAVFCWMPKQKQAKCITVDASLADAFVGHVSQGTIRILQSLTDPFLQQLQADNYLCAAMLARPILEHAGRAAFALLKVDTMSRAESFDSLQDLIPQLLFGSSFTVKKLEGTLFAEFADIRAGCPIKTSDYVDALEGFAGIDKTRAEATYFKGVYALLCECTHATQQALTFFQQVESVEDAPRKIAYVDSPASDLGGQLELLKATMRCLQAGYAASCMLSCFEFKDVGHTLTLKNSPALETGLWVHENILDSELVFGTKWAEGDSLT